MSLRILLLQARKPDDGAKEDEHRSFADRSGLPVEQFLVHDLLAGPPTLDRALSCDAIMVGGSGDYYVSKQNLPHFDAHMQFFRQIVELGHPTFASCFGFHLLAKALGGEVIHDLDATEVGTFDLTLTEAGSGDELLCSLPRRFTAQLGHKDRAQQLPSHCVNLACSQRVPFQAFRVRDKPIWATQFHPELNMEENRKRFRQYVEGYATYMSEAEREATLSKFAESPETDALIRKFIDLVFG